MADLFKFAERSMGMTDAIWRRHANPWSGWTRFSALPLLALAIWSRVWIGGFAWGAVALALFWVWLNPRLFPEPARFDAWMTKGVMGERVFLENRDNLPAHHLAAARLLIKRAQQVQAVAQDLGMGALGALVGRRGVWHVARGPTQGLVRGSHGVDLRRLAPRGARRARF